MGGHLTPQAIWKTVAQYAPIENLAPHDLRRTYAKLAKRGGATVDQIQFNLGHASRETTARYLGETLDLQQMPSDFIQLDISSD
ncbi:MAG: tyrosine-type recombinase/integrase, partial [Caldilineaceae bacterium]|nr:tyrosine-type recombinase/integrase [Caldilineaceae bacterium]